MSGRAYLSIGDVLTLLRQEFPDVTISKIRFLESQGLVDPERTPSGYRKFYEPDVERLRWVLRQQREHFLPLKVIKGRLEQTPEEPANGSHHLALEELEAHGASQPTVPAPVPEPALVGDRVAQASGGRPGRSRGEPLPGFAPGRSAPGPEPASPPTGRRPSEAGGARAGSPSPASASAPVPAPVPQAVSPGPVDEDPVVSLDDGEMTLDELAAASGCPASVVSGLESFGLLSGRQIGGVAYYADDALAVARLAAQFAAFGVEPRHLRLHKHAAEREAGFIEQVVLPLFKQRNPESRQRAHQSVGELTRLGQELRAVLLRRALRDQLGG